MTNTDRPWCTVTRYFTKQCHNCPSTNIYAVYERGTSNRVSEYRCCDCNCVWEEVQFRKWVYHPESDCAFEVNTENQLNQCLSLGCDEVSEYYATMVELGLQGEIDFEYETKLRMEDEYNR